LYQFEKKNKDIPRMENKNEFVMVESTIKTESNKDATVKVASASRCDDSQTTSPVNWFETFWKHMVPNDVPVSARTDPSNAFWNCVDALCQYVLYRLHHSDMMLVHHGLGTTTLTKEHTIQLIWFIRALTTTSYLFHDEVKAWFQEQTIVNKDNSPLGWKTPQVLGWEILLETIRVFVPYFQRKIEPVTVDSPEVDDETDDESANEGMVDISVTMTDEVWKAVLEQTKPLFDPMVPTQFGTAETGFAHYRGNITFMYRNTRAGKYIDLGGWISFCPDKYMPTQKPDIVRGTSLGPDQLPYFHRLVRYHEPFFWIGHTPMRGLFESGQALWPDVQHVPDRLSDLTAMEYISAHVLSKRYKPFHGRRGLTKSELTVLGMEMQSWLNGRPSPIIAGALELVRKHAGSLENSHFLDQWLCDSMKDPKIKEKMIVKKKEATPLEIFLISVAFICSACFFCWLVYNNPTHTKHYLLIEAQQNLMETKIRVSELERQLETCRAEKQKISPCYSAMVEKPEWWSPDRVFDGQDACTKSVDSCIESLQHCQHDVRLEYRAAHDHALPNEFVSDCPNCDDRIIPNTFDTTTFPTTVSTGQILIGTSTNVWSASMATYPSASNPPCVDKDDDNYEEDDESISALISDVEEQLARTSLKSVHLDIGKDESIVPIYASLIRDVETQLARISRKHTRLDIKGPTQETLDKLRALGNEFRKEHVQPTILTNTEWLGVNDFERAAQWIKRDIEHYHSMMCPLCKLHPDDLIYCTSCKSEPTA